MSQSIASVALLVPDYDEGIRFYVNALGFELIEDTMLPGGKRWVLVAPPGDGGCNLLLALADGEEQRRAIGNQAGGRVMLFLHTDNFERDFASYREAGVEFLEEPRHEAYGSVAVFRDAFGNKWDLIERKEQ